MDQNQVLAELVQSLPHKIQGEVHFDPFTRNLYSTDASIYQIQPQGVILPKVWDDVAATLEHLLIYDLCLTARGGGTSLGGQAIGTGLQLDFSKYLNRILEINWEAGWVRVEPGVILDQLNVALAPGGYWFGPDVATSARASLGGMIANNSAGIRSIVYGKTLDHILELELFLSDGSEITVKDLTPPEIAAWGQRQDLAGAIYRSLQTEMAALAPEIRARYPKILRRVSGYNLDEFVAPNKPWNLGKLIAGSEGTLALIKSAKLKIVPKPTQRGLIILYFKTLEAALEANHLLLETHPTAIELMDELLLNLTRANPGFAKKLRFMHTQAPVILLVEYSANSPLDLEKQIQEAESFCQKHHLGFARSRALEPALQADAWAIRKAGLPLLYGVPGERKPVAFVEDTAVAPEHLAAFATEFDALVKAHDTYAAYYAHASAGCLHIRPLIDLKQVSEVEKMRSLSEAVFELVLKYGGAMSGEHGDGLARSVYNERMFGSTIYQGFIRIKAAFDPQNRLNPGKIVHGPPITENLRYGGNYHPLSWPQTLAFTQDESFNRLVELCNGCGGCRKMGSGTMCPPYRVTRSEKDSTRGRANALRQVLTSQDLGALQAPELKAAMELCLGCKACKTECPSKVDLAKLKIEYLHQSHLQTGIPLRSQLLAQLKWLNHWGTLTTPVSNQLLQQLWFKKILEKTLGLSAQRNYPPFATQTFARWFVQRLAHPSPQKVVLFNDCYTNYNYPQVGHAAVKIFETLGYEVILPPQVCCGRPMLALGLLKQAKKQSQKFLRAYAPYLEGGHSIIGLEPSCLLSFRDEYLDLELAPDLSSKLAQNSLTLQEWLLQESEKRPLPFGEKSAQILYHEHCHQGAQVGAEVSLAVLNLPPGYQAQRIEAGCCGMAGAFGFEAEHLELSHAIANERLLPALKAAPAESKIVVSGVSCRQQISDLSGHRPIHLAEILAQALGTV